MKLIFATNNQHKVKEIQHVIGDQFELISLKDAGVNVDIPEPFDSLEENAAHKSSTIYNMTGFNCFSEDTGLEVFELNGEPGVKSARYSGEEKSFEKNIDKLLDKLKSIDNRNARFRTIISLRIDGIETQFEGVCNGVVTKSRKGSGGFGYDPVFMPEGTEKSFAEMTLEEKNKFSHRRKAVDKLVNYLLKINKDI